MNTDDLLSALASDASHSAPPIRQSLFAASLIGLLGAVPIFVVTLGLRPDLAEAVTTWRFDLKLVVVALAVVAAAVDCVRLSRPTETNPVGATTWLTIALLAGAVTLELASTPRAEWVEEQIGANAWLCLAAIPALALIPLCAAMWAMRSGAPASPAAAGAAVGRLAASLAAVLYATHCVDDSPLFVATWYSLAIMMVMAAGAVIGRSILRW